MADTCSNGVFQLVSVSHGGAAILSPMEFSYQETVEFVKHRPADRIAPCIAPKSYELRATVKRAEWAAPIVRGTKGDLVAVLNKIGAGTISVTLSNMQAGAAEGNQSQDIGTQSQEFEYDSGDTDNYAPIAVA